MTRSECSARSRGLHVALAIAWPAAFGCADEAAAPATSPSPPSIVGAPVAGSGGASAPTATGGAFAPAMPLPVGSAGSAAPSAGVGGSQGSAGQAGSAARSGQGGTAPSPDGGAGDATTPVDGCEQGVVAAEEVIFIGESFIALSGAIPRYTSELAREAGTIAMGESYRSYAVSGTQLTTGAIPMQYERAVREGPVKVVLMDGGGNDLLIGNRCRNGFDQGCQEIVAVVSTMFAQMKMGGVSDVVYFFYPDPMGIGAGIKGAMDILRPEMKAFCDAATDVRCIWVDQRESWDGNYATYTTDGIHPTDAGSMASAKQIWDAMVANCIAQ